MNSTAATLDNLFQDIPFLVSELIGKRKIEYLIIRSRCGSKPFSHGMVEIELRTPSNVV